MASDKEFENKFLHADEDLKYDLLLQIGKDGHAQHRSLVEDVLRESRDPMLVRLALQVLRRYWGFYAEYSKDMFRFAQGVAFDDEDDVRLLAISCLGDLIVRQSDPVKMQFLWHLYKDLAEEQIVREAAYCALATAVGTPPEDLPSAARHFDLSADVDPIVISKIRSMIRDVGSR